MHLQIAGICPVTRFYQRVSDIGYHNEIFNHIHYNWSKDESTSIWKYTPYSRIRKMTLSKKCIWCSPISYPFQWCIFEMAWEWKHTHKIMDTIFSHLTLKSLSSQNSSIKDLPIMTSNSHISKMNIRTDNNTIFPNIHTDCDLSVHPNANPKHELKEKDLLNYHLKSQYHYRWSQASKQITVRNSHKSAFKDNQNTPFDSTHKQTNTLIRMKFSTHDPLKKA